MTASHVQRECTFSLAMCLKNVNKHKQFSFLEKMRKYSQEDAIKTVVLMSLKVVHMYEWLLDLYVLDFFVDNHWEKLPSTWRHAFQDLDPTDMGKIMVGVQTRHVLPLSFLSLLKTVKALTLPREIQKLSTSHSIEASQSNDTHFTCANHPRLKNLFLKHVKLKKRHEISLMADVVSDVSVKSQCPSVIDFGSGLGHLVRVLAYKNDMFAAGIECQTPLTIEARKLDQELEYTARKYLAEDIMTKLHQPHHIDMTLSSLDQLKDIPLPATMSNYGLVGLHPCGDLGPLLLRHFATDSHIKFICVVGCCFMKLTCDSEGTGYPMSKYVMSMENRLSFVSREISCHAIEVYCDRLMKGNYSDLKIHAFRAALEKILVEYDPKLKHAGVRSIKHSENMTFHDYSALALARLSVPPPSARTVARAQLSLRAWRRCVLVYSLRLALAPLVETVVLLDRVLFLLEHGLSCEIRPVFDPKISPRNHIIIGRRL